MKNYAKGLLSVLLGLSLIFATGLVVSSTVSYNQTSLSLATERLLIPGGQAFGVRLYTEGAIVVDISEFESAAGTVCPARDGGIQIADTIIAINGQKICSNDDIAKTVEQCPKEPLNVTLKRKDKIIQTTVTPLLSLAQEEYKIGLWVRDSTAGIGTITYFDPQNNTLAGLGHGINDIDTGILMPMYRGQVVGANITGVVKGEKGNPGQLSGIFDDDIVYGDLISNSSIGLFGRTTSFIPNKSKAIPIGYKDQIYEGAVKILCTVNGVGAQEFDAEIISVNKLLSDTKNMTLKITDSELLSLTGGIVQGMSGSPIIQDGKLVGAVTHVLVNDPTRGYGIFIENMLETAQSVANEQLKEAS